MGLKTASLFNLVNEKFGKCCDGLFLVDKTGVIRYLNEKSERILSKELFIEQGANVLESSLASYFADPANETEEFNKETGGLYNSLYNITVEQLISENGEKKGWLGILTEKNETHSAYKHNWGIDTEELVQQISLRYAHELLNAMTPVYGILQMMKDDTISSSKQIELMDLAQREVEKSKIYVNDFMSINYPHAPAPKWHKAGVLLNSMREQVEEQAPEFIPYLDWEIIGKEEDKIFIDTNHLRMMLQLLVKKWVDFAKGPSTIEITFQTNEETFNVCMKMTGSNKEIFYSDNEFDYYLHLVNKLMKKNGGSLNVHEGLTLVYPAYKNSYV